MNLDHKLLSELKKFKMMANYTPGNVLNEQKVILEKTQFYGKTYVYYNETSGSLKGVTIGYIDDKTQYFYPNKNGSKLFDLEKNSSYKIGGSDTYFNNIWDLHTKDKTFMFDFALDDRIGEIESKNKMVQKTLDDVEGADWKDGTSGSLIFISDKSPAASNIKGPGTMNVGTTKSWNLLYAEIKNHYSVIDKPDDTTPPNPNVIDIDDNFVVNGARKTFCDNVVDVDLTVKENLDELDNIVKKIEAYITAPNDDEGNTSLSKFKMSIMGQADSAAPGWLPGEPCNKTTTEIGHNYGGMEKKPRKDRTDDDLHKMNLYLATMRAKNYKNLIIDEIKKRTGITIEIQELPAKEYYGEGTSKRGSQWRSMVLTSSSPEHIWTEKIPIDPKEKKNENIVDYEKIKQAGYEKVKVVLKTNDIANQFKLFTNTLMRDNTFYVEAIPENLKYLSKYSDNEYSISDASVSTSNGFQFNITTNDGNSYKFTPKLGVNAGEAATKIASKAVLSQFNCKAQGIAAFLNDPRGSWEFASFVTDFNGKPFDDSLDMYDENSQVTINNKTYYKIVSVGFQLIGTNCQAYETIQWPTEEEVKMLEKLRSQETYSDKELEKMKKNIEDQKNNKIKRTQNRMRSGPGEEIQNDIQLR